MGYGSKASAKGAVDGDPFRALARTASLQHVSDCAASACWNERRVFDASAGQDEHVCIARSVQVAYVTATTEERIRNGDCWPERVDQAWWCATTAVPVDHVPQVLWKRQHHAVERMPASAKLVSLFEPHTAIVQRGKAHVPAEFGRKIVLEEVDGGLVTRYAALAGNPSIRCTGAADRPGSPPGVFRSRCSRALRRSRLLHAQQRAVRTRASSAGSAAQCRSDRRPEAGR